MKTQMVKNSVIVPVGSKGGFVLKGVLPARPALDAYLVERYREFVSGLLDVTDNIVDGKVLHPPEVVRYDGDDPYLVVAADKGTAHLSDTANHVSAQYGFWLGDAFASGGSVGYDHKKEGITARGAWECVKHHFSNLGIDVQTQSFTMAGVGDMSGDVFGNGALQSRATRLVAAFDHRHIFLDPNPDAERSYAERERMFRLPRSSWRDYDASIISAGGGVFDRGAKSIPVSPEVRALLDIDQAEVSGEEMIRRILTSRVDLLYNGGIGPYVKSTAETDARVGDRANDRVRVNASDVRARVIAEGGNLGLTQLARIEYWAHGGLINTDAVDNSGGVDMSDHEVNLKILLDLLVRSGVIKSRHDRNRLLAEMTDDVSALVLADNASQARALTLDGLRSAAAYDDHVAFLERLVAAGIVNRQDDALPTREELASGPGHERGLPRPVIAVLLGHTKNWAFRELLATDVVEGAAARPFLDAYFPGRLRAEYAGHFEAHPLRREIIATGVVNHLVNHAGVSFLHRVMASTGADLGRVVAAHLDVDREIDAVSLREAVFASGRPVAAEHAALLEVENAIEQAVVASLEGDKARAAQVLNGVKAKAGA
jgi:glutamate dehydrogenase